MRRKGRKKVYNLGVTAIFLRLGFAPRKLRPVCFRLRLLVLAISVMPSKMLRVTLPMIDCQISMDGVDMIRNRTRGEQAAVIQPSLMAYIPSLQSVSNETTSVPVARFSSVNTWPTGRNFVSTLTKMLVNGSPSLCFTHEFR